MICPDCHQPMARNGVRNNFQRWRCERVRLHASKTSTSMFDLDRVLKTRPHNPSPFVPPQSWKKPAGLDGRRYKSEV